MRDGPSATPTLRDIEAADLVLVLGEDLTNTAPMLDFSVRRWARLRPTADEERLGIARWNDAGVGMVKKEEPSALWIAATHAGKLDEIAAEAYHGAPDDLVRFTLALNAALKAKGGRRAAKGLTADEARLVERFAAALRDARRPVVISGVSCGSPALLEAAAALARALPGPPRPPPRRSHWSCPKRTRWASCCSAAAGCPRPSVSPPRAPSRSPW